jgi:hypothetical protein
VWLEINLEVFIKIKPPSTNIFIGAKAILLDSHQRHAAEPVLGSGK